MSDNASAHSSAEYDRSIAATIPFYDCFSQSAIDLAAHLGKPTGKWLDTGCGTGTLCADARERFPHTEFTLADPSAQMLDVAKGKLSPDDRVSFILAGTQSLVCPDEYFDVITAIQCHHYLDKETRSRAIGNCFRMLKPGGLLIAFENIRPLTEPGQEIGLKRWESYQISRGKTAVAAAEHIKRFDKEYFPISILDHLCLLKNAGFSAVEVLWASYLQAGFYAIK